MSESTRRRETTVTRLIEAGIQQFAARGIDATSVEHLCEAAGFTRGAFYSNFSTKDDLCLAILARHRDHILTHLASTLAEVPIHSDLTQVARSALRSLFEIIAPSQDVAVTILEIQLRARRNPELAQRLDQFAAETTPALVDFVTKLTERLNVEFSLSPEQVLAIFEALYFIDTHRIKVNRIDDLMVPLAIALGRTRTEQQPEGQRAETMNP